MRVFAGIPLSAEGAERVAEICSRLSDNPVLAAFRWVPPRNIHLTLRFFGDVAEDKVDAIADSLSRTCARAGAVEFSLNGLGVFPRPSNPSVLWAGPDETPIEISALHENLESALAAEGYPADERLFRPHLTIGRRRRRERVSNGLADALREAEQTYLRPPPVLLFSEAALFKSDLLPGGAVYTVLHTAPFAS